MLVCALVAMGKRKCCSKSAGMNDVFICSLW